MPTYRNISRHVQDAGDGRVVGLYEEFDSDADVSSQVKEGVFLDITQTTPVQPPAARKRGEAQTKSETTE